MAEAGVAAVAVVAGVARVAQVAVAVAHSRRPMLAVGSQEAQDRRLVPTPAVATMVVVQLFHTALVDDP